MNVIEIRQIDAEDAPTDRTVGFPSVRWLDEDGDWKLWPKPPASVEVLYDSYMRPRCYVAHLPPSPAQD